MLCRLFVAICVCTLFISFGGQSTTLAAKQEISGSCIEILDPIRPGETASVVKDFQCFATFAEVIEYLSKGQVVVPHDTKPYELTQEMADHIAAISGSTLLGIQYELVNYRTDPQAGWDSFSRATANSDACNGYSYGRPSMESGWNNVIQSARIMHASCKVFEHYDGTSWTGDRIFCTPNCADMGVPPSGMNQRTSSWRITG
ncbi:MAG: hypothetical protein GFH27_549445n45 [Chloroflexi bacterium AL-W]|nr:hypothetical protein [Chloroflexi bacterium AL-N1]NOK71701.1 hypothetical protein [Chloroflexi bacterium AL-N10]NOK79042.1 hypothetical protein [Chloroflexi bacterium AL-N5]NOK86476.1 hypothetical protein [Chloroflexi bacterium AL-W]NOK93442.1 hypothetical protein [Chloroflexi bacterium AL-N15]